MKTPFPSESEDIAVHESWFAGYAERQYALCEGDAGPMRLKEQHTRAVLGYARRMAQEEGFAPHIVRACLLAALYHDVARFAQYLRYGTFRDRDSRNHGLWGAAILKREGRLAQEDATVRRLVLTAVALHNRYALPAALPDDMACVAWTVRDADKLDILRVMDEHLSGPRPYCPTVVLGLPDTADKVSGKVLEDALQGRVASYTDLRSVNDFRVLLGTWLDDMHFACSRRLFAESPHAERLLLGLPQEGPYAAVRACLLRRLASVRQQSARPDGGA
ncbi:HD domain-containing protein [uncultured Desulfovibrio sp.]|uniref:HD domain-containing protein n=1 Tax=uncultured Desulfovibrio sp. TaxID=167968 RepID=UPI00261F7BC1|nr:HD domain-containing protein [uncultured Desulfovibrio sp.]